jgi:hypothetical protein
MARSNVAVTTKAGQTVVFIKPDGDFSLRMSAPYVSQILEGAKSLKATHFVMQDDFDMRANLPIWGVFAMRDVQKNNPHPGAYCIGAPRKRFTAATPDAAVMWALAMREKI